MAKKKVTIKKTAKKKVAKKKTVERKVARRRKFPPAYFLSLSVENVRCFGPKQTIDLSDGKGRPVQWTVIIGDNNVGKTTLLQCFVAMEPELEEVGNKEFASPSIFRFYLPQRSRKLYRSKGERPLFISVVASFGTKLSMPTNKASTVSLSVRLNYSEVGRLMSGTSRAGRSTELGNLICYGYGASRMMGGTSLSEKPSGGPSASLFGDDVELINAEEWLLQADYAASKSTSTLRQKAKKRRDQIVDILIHLLPEIDDIRFTERTKNRSQPGVEFKTPYGWVTLDDLSLGYKTLIAWMVDFASRMFDRYPKSPNPLAEPAVVLVDEIDLHLHPKWQRTLMGYLSKRFKNTQFIVTAHSPLVVQAAGDSNIVLLKRKGDHVVIDNNPLSVLGWRADQILTSLFGLESSRSVQIEELQKERRKILSKAKLMAADKKKLAEIESKMGDLPIAETPEEIEAMDIVRRAAKRLKK